MAIQPASGSPRSLRERCEPWKFPESCCPDSWKCPNQRRWDFISSLEVKMTKVHLQCTSARLARSKIACTRIKVLVIPGIGLLPYFLSPMHSPAPTWAIWNGIPFRRHERLHVFGWRTAMEDRAPILRLRWKPIAKRYTRPLRYCWRRWAIRRSNHLRTGARQPNFSARALIRKPKGCMAAKAWLSSEGLWGAVRSSHPSARLPWPFVSSCSPRR